MKTTDTHLTFDRHYLGEYVWGEHHKRKPGRDKVKMFYGENLRQISLEFDDGEKFETPLANVKQQGGHRIAPLLAEPLDEAARLVGEKGLR